MRKIFLDEKNVGMVVSWIRNFMKKQFKLEKLQYDRNTKKWVLTLEKIYPGTEKVSKQNNISELIHIKLEDDQHIKLAKGMKIVNKGSEFSAEVPGQRERLKFVGHGI